MLLQHLFFVLTVATATRGLCKLDPCDTTIFPANFKFGTASSAYQVEGAWNADGKSRSWWDWFMNTYATVNGNTACDSYHKYQEDVAALQEIGVNFYRFSISWSRILPNGITSEINQAGVDYYNNLLNELDIAGIEPLVTLFHWDIPYTFSYLGDWSNRQIIDYFVAYADLAFSLFGERVKLWATINEPRSFCVEMPTIIKEYYLKEFPLGLYEYLCGHHALLAHAYAYRLYKSKYKASQNGRVGIVLNLDANIPSTNSTEDIEAAERANVFDFGWLADPLVYGDYPQLLKDSIGSNSEAQNLSFSRLPTFSVQERNILKGAYDLFFINHYSANSISASTSSDGISWNHDKGVVSSLSSEWGVTNIGFAILPESIRIILKYISDNYRRPEIVITENGYSNVGGLNDTDRIEFIQNVLYQVRLAMCEDNVKLTGYTYWSLLDSFEWNSGYNAKFGLVHVDFDSSNLTRTLKDSAYYYRNFIASRLINTTVDE